MDSLWLNSVLGDEEEAEQFLSDWEASVSQFVPEEKLLVFQARDGWAPLCQFLGREIPSFPFPRLNNANQFKSGYKR